MNRLIILIITIACGSFGKSISQTDYITVPVSEYKAGLKLMADGELCFQDVINLRLDTAAYRNELRAKDELIARQAAQITEGLRIIEASQANSLSREKIIDKLSKPVKKWSVGVGAGYGLAGTKPGAFIGLSITRSLIRF